MNILKRNIEQDSYLNNYLNNLILIFLLMSIVFSRSFLGINIFGFRVGELAMAFSAFVFLFSTFFYVKKIIQKYKYILISSYIILIAFLVTVVFTESNLLNLYTYKSSSYIWTLGFLYIGLLLKNKDLMNIKYIFLFQFVLIIIYLVAIFDFPELVIKFFINFSDKYEPHKGSDITINFIILILFINKFFNYKQKGYVLFILNIALFAPLLIYKSRAAFIAVMFFLIYEIYKYRNEIFKFDIRKIILYLLACLLFTISTFTSQKYVVVEFSAETLDQIPSAFKNLGQYKFSKYKDDYPILYISESRLYSGDGNLNWRFQLWQDAIEDNKQENKLFYGIGYKEKFNVFIENNLVNTAGVADGNDRRGLDGLNEHVHNYLLTIFLRGGYLKLFSFLILHLSFFYYAKKNKKLLSMTFFYFPIMFVSFFDSSMENAHFPLIFFYTLSTQFLKSSEY